MHIPFVYAIMVLKLFGANIFYRATDRKKLTFVPVGGGVIISMAAPIGVSGGALIVAHVAAEFKR